ncbi:GntR family transcriptional regulator [Mangrovimonas spongiae]|uniref:GntR family transcriptional regulator n=1 Tax=Mangrovimonas spongiae TaxID=2494697 RepID=A0A428K645_9FLAO|nr:GntR family transcriptional regulator [Mangrovimonas spongiae]RSK41897.1 GntR family transcriptional regulator [Mangrovimonas spongiae]
MSIISVSEKLGVPKYKQIVSSIEDGLSSGLLKKGDKLPSINSIRNKFDLSRDTVLMAFNELKMRGIVESISGKGYYVKSEDIGVKQKIFLLFDELNAFKEELYYAFLQELDDDIQVDIFFHHFSFNVFQKHIYDSIGNYNYYVVMPANLPDTHLVLDKLPEDKVYLLDQTSKELAHFPSVHQNFEETIFSNLKDAFHLIEKYEKITLLFSDIKQPKGVISGFQKFEKSVDFPCDIIDSLKYRDIKKGEVYVVLDDRDLIFLIKKIKEQNYKVGEDVGIISYNDTLLKEVVENGITTISTDFKTMGKRLAQMLANNEKLNVENPNTLIIRNSL